MKGGRTLFFHLYTLFSCIKKIVNLVDTLGFQAIALPSIEQTVIGCQRLLQDLSQFYQL